MEDAPRFGRDAGPQPPLWQDGEVNGLGKLGVSGSQREEDAVDKAAGCETRGRGGQRKRGL